MEYTQYMKDEVKALEDYARDHYEEGGHWVYETYDTEDYEKLLLSVSCIEDAKKQLKDFWELKQGVYEDVRGCADFG